MRSSQRFVAATVTILFAAVCSAQQPAVSPFTPGERAAIRAFDRAETSPAELRAFLARMPKGGDLHLHLSGAVYAETFLREAAEDGLCADASAHTFVHGTPSQAGRTLCASGQVPAFEVPKNPALYTAMVDALSMRSFVPSSGISGHDHFFATFDLADPEHNAADRHAGEWLDEVKTRAAAERVQYVEVMHSPGLGPILPAAASIGWPQPTATDPDGTSSTTLSALRTALLAGPLSALILQQSAMYGIVVADTARREHCDTPAALPACAVDVRFLYYGLREGPPERVFTQLVAAFEVASRNPLVAGINLVQPEDGFFSMSEYTRQMRMLDYLHGAYPRVHISLHAGELAQGLVPPEGLRDHIRQAVEVGHAERIGHGVDIMYETDAAALLQEMARKHVLVEINLTSNDVILGVSGAEHPLASYIAAGVPVALSTDDEGVSRIDMTHEWTRAVLDQHMRYPELKTMARASLEHSFLPGQSLWANPGDFNHRTAACASAKLDQPAAACSAFLAANERARQQWQLERSFTAFESGFLARK